MRGADAGLATSPLGHTLTGAGPRITLASSHPTNIFVFLHKDNSNIHAAVEVHAVDTNRRVVLDAEIDVLRDTEAEVARLAEVALPQLVLLDLEATLEDLLCLWAANGDMDGDFLITTDAECADGVPRFA